MSNKPFHCQAPLPPKKDDAEYYLLASEHVSISKFEGQKILKAAPEALTLLACQAFHDVLFVLRPAHRQQVVDILRDLETNENDKYVALQFLRSSDIATKGVLSIYQDTDTAIIVGRKGQRIRTGGDGEAVLAYGVYNTYTEDNLCYSQDAPLSMYKEVNTGTNSSAQIDLYAVDGGEYKFLYIAKSGGSANKTYLYQETKALPTSGKLKSYLAKKMRTPGTAACPSYHIVFVIDGTSAETNLKMVKLASAKYYDELPTEGNEHGQVFRDVELERELLIGAQSLGLGAQFGGKCFVHDICVIHLPRHGAFCPVGMGVSCSTDHNAKVKVSRQGTWIEKLEHSPDKYISEELRKARRGGAARVNLSRPMKETLAQLPQCSVSTRLSLDGVVIVGRNIAHAKPKEQMDNGEGLSQYIKDHPTYYAGPAKMPEGYAPGSLGPTTAGRTDFYVDRLRAQGGSMIMLAKGNHSQQVTDACEEHGSFYLGSVGSPVAILARGNTKSLEYAEYPELGMEAIWKIEMEDLPVFILVDDKGNDFFQQIQLTRHTRCVKQTELPFGAVFSHGTKD